MSKKDKRKGQPAKQPEGSAPGARSTARTGRTQRLTTIVPVRFEPAMLDAVRSRAEADGRSVSAWIRRTVELELARHAGARERSTPHDDTAPRAHVR